MTRPDKLERFNVRFTIGETRADIAACTATAPAPR